MDQASKSLEQLTSEATPLLEEVTTTVTLVNGPLHAINKVSKNIEEVSGKIAEATEGFLGKNSMGLKVAGGLLNLFQAGKAKSPRKNASRKKAAAGEQE